ncbi:MAG: hypothetical protein ACOWWM_08960 [Desulfobacterales bacterium]
MDGIVLAGVLVGLVLGSLGYVLFFSVIRPIAGYRSIRRRIDRLLPGELPAADTGTEARKSALELAELLRRCYEEQLPFWYRQMLDQRGEKPSEAAGGLQKLATLKDRSAATAAAARVRGHLRLGP